MEVRTASGYPHVIVNGGILKTPYLFALGVIESVDISDLERHIEFYMVSHNMEVCMSIYPMRSVRLKKLVLEWAEAFGKPLLPRIYHRLLLHLNQSGHPATIIRKFPHMENGIVPENVENKTLKTPLSTTLWKNPAKKACYMPVVYYGRCNYTTEMSRKMLIGG